MVIVSEWVDNVENTKTFLCTSGLIMASTENLVLNTNEDTIKKEWNQVSQNNNRSNISTTECARAVLLCHQNSHPFVTRTLLLEPDQEVKVGRSIARSRVSENNAIFDCKVLSRNHAVIWYGNGKFYVKDTKSSNGTFINEHRINPSEEEELHSEDVVKFGVDVIENSRKEVHGCIIACIKLYLPDGREYISNSSDRVLTGEGGITIDVLQRLNHYLQETIQREKLIESKINDTHKCIEFSRQNTSFLWQAMINEDRLLNRIDILENKLQFFQKKASENDLRDEILKLQEDKNVYQNSAKEALRKVYQERTEAVQKLTTIERALSSSEDECSLLRDQLLRAQDNLQEVNSKLLHVEEECKEHREKNERTQNQVQKQDMKAQQLYAQIVQLEQQCLDYKQQIELMAMDKTALQEKLASKETDDESAKDKKVNWEANKLSSKGTIMKWLENSDLKTREGSDDIISAICNDTDSEVFDEDSYIRLASVFDRLSVVQKNLNEANNECDKEKLSIEKLTLTNDDPISDGNKNLQMKLDCLQVLLFSGSELLGIYNELLHYTKCLKKENDKYKCVESYEELERKLASITEELSHMQREMQERPTKEELDEKNKLNECLQNELDYVRITVDELKREVTKLDNELLKRLNNADKKEAYLNKKVQTCSDLTEFWDDCQEECRQIQYEKEILNNKNIQYEEELVCYKEQHEKTLSENLELKRVITMLKSEIGIIEIRILKKVVLYGFLFVGLFYFLFKL